MSSLAQQLSGVAQATQTLALDRKRRSKLHSVSFLYEAQHAATQDYDSIYTEALESLERLETLDRRFGKFKLSIFSETSIGIDRQVQSKEQNDDLDKTINVFLSLIAPYWHLAISVKAAEWLLRRFQINHYNAEYLLLSTLPYFDQPIFERVLYVIPKFPTMFQWLNGFKKANNKLPSRNSVLKAFTDVDFFNLYSKFVIEELQHNNQYRKQLVFFVSMAISTLAVMSSNGSEKFSDLVPLILEVCGSLLISKNQESKISAYTILAVLSSAVPLSRDVIIASIDTILLQSGNSTNSLSTQAFQCILKLYQTVQSGALEPLPATTFKHLPKSLFSEDSEYLDLIKASTFNSKFVCSYLRSMIVNNIPITKSILQSVTQDFEFSSSQMKIILAESLKKVNSKEVEDVSIFTPVFKFIISKDESLFLSTLKQLDVELDQLEMLLQTTLLNNSKFDEGDEVIDVEDVVNDDGPVAEDLEIRFESAKSFIPSFLFATKDTDEAFYKLQGLFLESMQSSATLTFLKTCFVDRPAIISFLLRVSTSLNTPMKGRTFALKLLKSQIESLDKKIHVYTILPILSTLLINPQTQIRVNAGDVLKAMNDRTTSGAKELLLSGTIYGPDLSTKIATLSPKDGLSLMSKLVECIPNLRIDGDQFHKHFESIVGDKKLGKITLAFYASHANMVNAPSIKMNLMEIVMKGARAIKGAASPSQLFEHLLAKFISKRQVWYNRCEETGCDFKLFEAQVVGLVSPKEKNEAVIKFLEEALNSQYVSLVDAATAKLIEILPTLKLEYQLHIVNSIVENGLAEDDDSATHVIYDPVELLESLTLSNEVFVALLKGALLSANPSSDSQFQKGGVPKRRRRSSASIRQAMKEQGISDMASTHLKKVTMILDVLDKATSSPTFKASFDILKSLFNILDDLETLGKDGKLPILYSQETLASCMINTINILKESGLDMKDSLSIRADVVVSAIRSSHSPQAQNKLLLVVAALASLSPELALHSVMPIFTFMGAHTIRQDDEFSSHAVEQTVLCVVPALANATGGNMIEEIEFLLISFVSAFLHIPRHRRVRLFTTLAKTLGSEHSVYLILFLCGQQYSSAYAKHKMGDCSALIDFASSFLQNFSADEQLDAAKKFLELWKMVPEDALEKESDEYKALLPRAVFGPSVVSMNKSELFNLRKGMVSFLKHSIVDSRSSAGIPRLRLKIASLILQGEDTENLSTNFAAVVTSILDIIDNYHGNNSEEEILTKLYKLLGDVLSLLPIGHFVKAIASILLSKDTSLRTMRHITVLTASKFELEYIDDLYAHEGITTLVPILLENVTSQKDVELSQASLDSLSSIFQRFSDRVDSSLLLKTLGVVTTDAGLLNERSAELIVSSINCITSIVSIVGVKMIGFFPRVVPPLFKIFEKTKESEDDSSKLIQISVLILFSSLIKKIPSFLTPNLKDILKVTFNASSVPDSIRTSVLNVIVEYVELKTTLVSLCSLWSYVSKLDASSIGLYLSTLELAIDNMEKKTVISEASTFIKFFLYALEFRAESNFDTNTIHRIESSIYKCGIQYVMKLNDKSFRPLFASIVRWAFDGEGKTTSISELERLQSFYKFFNKLQESLKSIITSYYSYLLDSTTTLLNKFAKGEMVDINLRRLVLISLTSSFKYDQDEYWQSNTRFTPISTALCDQFSNVEDAIGKYLVKCITSLVQDTSSSDDFNKATNEMLLSHMKAYCNPREKFWAIRTLKTVYKKVGENWLSLLPQLVPIIAELLEDDDEEVEMEVRNGLVKVLEDVMGEPLDRYLE
ncbi:hypothetical protein CANARDRAFT_9557 [[Candida] arabinofermentans NRRL YB-2248]|uniref:U3 small nucleolar RNA-associated protein 10 n=1 Tax=[Candida] arabinofermentans NRRL YB-2248 TaxID=983967 RepID=A0A1E4SVL0_9ASCO|nr:hypothetical protein CANARDRAFT_9557 [[Candida] arabinofermentans NRRL YB-2248]